MPFRIMKLLSPCIKYLFDTELITPKSLLLWPRLFMTFLSFICDFCVYKIACICYIRPWQCVEVFAGSYIMLVYATKTFSNSVELILQCILLCRVCVSMIETTKTIRTERVLDNLYESSDTMKEKVKVARTKKKLPAYNFGDSFSLSVLITIGIFIRPTFICFAFVPLAYWLQRGVVTRQISFSYFNYRCFSLVPGIFLTATACILIDSFYYDTVTFTELMLGNVTVKSFTVTPINFVFYNFKTSNVAEHGLHPYLLHILVNIPILHGILGILGLWFVSRYFASFIYHPLTKKPNIASMASMLLLSFIFPVLVLSIIPHQEPRFLLPTLPPLAILLSEKVSIYSLSKLKFTKHFIFLCWQTWNVLCVIFYGFLHQGGVTKTMIFIHDYVALQDVTNDYHVFFSHTYTPPTFLLNRKIPVLADTEYGGKYRFEKSITIHDLGSSLDIDEIYEKLNVSFPPQKWSNKVYTILCIPASLSLDLEDSANSKNASVKRIIRMPGHFTAEKIPPFHLSKTLATKECNEACQLSRRIKEFSIDVYMVSFNSSLDAVSLIKPIDNKVDSKKDRDEL